MHLISLIRLQCQRCVLSKGLRAVHGWQLLDVVLAGLCMVVCPRGWSSVVRRTVWGHSTAEHTVKHKGWYSNTHNLLLVWQWCLLHGMQLPHLYWAHLLPLPLHSPLPHKEDGRSGKGGEEGRGMMLQRAHPHFTDKQVVASEVTGPTWFSSQCMTYGH